MSYQSLQSPSRRNSYKSAQQQPMGPVYDSQAAYLAAQQQQQQAANSQRKSRSRTPTRIASAPGYVAPQPVYTSPRPRSKSRSRSKSRTRVASNPNVMPSPIMSYRGPTRGRTTNTNVPVTPPSSQSSSYRSASPSRRASIATYSASNPQTYEPAQQEATVRQPSRRKSRTSRTNPSAYYNEAPSVGELQNYSEELNQNEYNTPSEETYQQEMEMPRTPTRKSRTAARSNPSAYYNEQLPSEEQAYEQEQLEPVRTPTRKSRTARSNPSAYYNEPPTVAELQNWSNELNNLNQGNVYNTPSRRTSQYVQPPRTRASRTKSARQLDFPAPEPNDMPLVGANW